MIKKEITHVKVKETHPIQVRQIVHGEYLMKKSLLQTVLALIVLATMFASAFGLTTAQAAGSGPEITFEKLSANWVAVFSAQTQYYDNLPQKAFVASPGQPTAIIMLSWKACTVRGENRLCVKFRVSEKADIQFTVYPGDVSMNNVPVQSDWFAYSKGFFAKALVPHRTFTEVHIESGGGGPNVRIVNQADGFVTVAFPATFANYKPKYVYEHLGMSQRIRTIRIPWGNCKTVSDEICAKFSTAATSDMNFDVIPGTTSFTPRGTWQIYGFGFYR